MFSDNATVIEYSMSKDKVSYYINYGIAPIFRDEMLLTCVKWPFDSVLFDGSFYHIFRDDQLDVYIIIRIWDCVKCQASTRYPTSKFLKSTHAENLLNVLIDAISCMNGRKIIMKKNGKEKLLWKRKRES